ncbi:hypothetical protein [Salmonella enterica]|uniref:hypothetical protein n=1 Tax=Salmonella enterica TaxID=28901 RepID=UPI00398C3335
MAALIGGWGTQVGGEVGLAGQKREKRGAKGVGGRIQALIQAERREKGRSLVISATLGIKESA